MDRSNHDYERLLQALQDEINWTAQRASNLRVMRDAIKSHRNNYVAEGWAQVGQDIVSELTHRSNVHPQTIVRSCALLAADAAIDWDAKQRAQKVADAWFAEQDAKT